MPHTRPTHAASQCVAVKTCGNAVQTVSPLTIVADRTPDYVSEAMFKRGQDSNATSTRLNVPAVPNERGKMLYFTKRATISAALCASFLLAAPMVFAQSFLCPNGSYVSSGPCTLCPDGSYVGGGAQCALTPGGDTYPVAQAHRNWPLTALGILAAETQFSAQMGPTLREVVVSSLHLADTSAAESRPRDNENANDVSVGWCTPLHSRGVLNQRRSPRR